MIQNFYAHIRPKKGNDSLTHINVMLEPIIVAKIKC